MVRGFSKHRRTDTEKLLTNLLCPIIAVYKVTNEGRMQRSHEVDAKMSGYFSRSGHGNMELTRSLDKKMISLCNFDHSSPTE